MRITSEIDDLDAAEQVPSLRLGDAEPHAAGCETLVAVETPVEIVIGLAPFAVMMLSPADLEDFATGFCLTEGIIDRFDDIRAIASSGDATAIRLRIDLAPALLGRHFGRRRAISGRTGCGVCGVEDLASLVRAPIELPRPPAIGMAEITRALDGLEDAQTLNARTRAVHAAAWCDPSGRVLHLREDVGRHNALDKLIGCLMRAGVDPARGFVVVTSRCSFEMIDKTAAFGSSALVAVSAPTSFALHRARALGMRLIAVARRDGAILFNDPQDGATATRIA